MTVTLSITEIILLIIVQAVITANIVLCALYLRDTYLDRRSDREWAEQQNMDAWLDDSHVEDRPFWATDDDLPY